MSERTWRVIAWGAAGGFLMVAFGIPAWSGESWAFAIGFNVIGALLNWGLWPAPDTPNPQEGEAV